LEAAQSEQPHEPDMTNTGALTLTREQAARRLQISISMLDALTKAGRIGHFKAGRRILFNDDHLIEYLSSIQRSTRTA
jgi:excisionase family DNA binding protein